MMRIYIIVYWELMPITLDRTETKRVVVEAPNVIQALRLVNKHPDLVEYIMDEKKQKYSLVVDHNTQSIQFMPYVKPFQYFPNGDYLN